MADNRHKGSSIDDFLKEEGVFENYQARAIKEVMAWRFEREIKDQTGRAQITHEVDDE